MNLLFVCSRNRLRSPTAEHVFAETPGCETDSAGLDHDAVQPLDAEQVRWADVIFVMESFHLAKLKRRHASALKGKRVVRLGIPDNYDYMDPELVALLESRVRPHLARR